jgi:hypothetical protein
VCRRRTRWMEKHGRLLLQTSSGAWEQSVLCLESVGAGCLQLGMLPCTSSTIVCWPYSPVRQCLSMSATVAPYFTYLLHVGDGVVMAYIIVVAKIRRLSGRLIILIFYSCVCLQLRIVLLSIVGPVTAATTITVTQSFINVD